MVIDERLVKLNSRDYYIQGYVDDIVIYIWKNVLPQYQDVKMVKN